MNATDAPTNSTPNWAEAPPRPMPAKEATWRNSRTEDDVLKLILALRDNPSVFAIYSEHVSLKAARQRIALRKKAKSLEGMPLQWRSQHAEAYNSAAPWYVLVAWEATEDGDPAPMAPGHELPVPVTPV